MNNAMDRRELFFKALAGLLGGAIGWIPVEMATHGRSITEQESALTVIAGIVSVALVAGMIGGMILAAEGNSLEITPLAKRRFLLGFIVCLVLALPETYYSDLIFSKILRAGGWGVDHPGSELYLVGGRLIGWTFMGLMLGFGVGLASLSLRNALKGALGGLIGGLVGGAGFDLIGSFSQSGLASRLITPSIRYSKPELQTHVIYLYTMTNNTDQKVGRDGQDRYTALRQELDALMSELDKLK